MSIALRCLDSRILYRYYSPSLGNSYIEKNFKYSTASLRKPAMLSEKRVSTLRPGDMFRDWLINITGERIRDKKCNVAVYKISPASHTVCRYEFEGENYSVVAKFYAEPTGWHIKYDSARSMQQEFNALRSVANIVNVPRPLAVNKDFHCVLVTEHIRGKPLFKFMKSEKGLYDRLTTTAHTLRKLHDQTKSDYRKQDEFAHFHKILDQLQLNSSKRLEFNRLLGDWWYSTLIDQSSAAEYITIPIPSTSSSTTISSYSWISRAPGSMPILCMIWEL